MIIEQPPRLFRWFFPHTCWKIKAEKNEQKCVYLTFDDGPIPEMTPWVLDLLDKRHIKATFFCVGENAMRNPALLEEIKRRGHKIGNHSHTHQKGLRISAKDYRQNVDTANEYLQASLYRPPHGLISRKQLKEVQKKYQVVMWDVVTRDYSKVRDGEQVLDAVKKYTRNGSIIVFHDSLRAQNNIRYALPLALEWLQKENYVFKLL